MTLTEIIQYGPTWTVVLGVAVGVILAVGLAGERRLLQEEGHDDDR